MKLFLHRLGEWLAPSKRSVRYTRGYVQCDPYRMFLDGATDLHDLERRLRTVYTGSAPPRYY